MTSMSANVGPLFGTRWYVPEPDGWFSEQWININLKSPFYFT